jgi:alpha-L-rhamnosidase
MLIGRERTLVRVTLRCIDLRCERLVDPIGLDTRSPRLTWRIEADGDEVDVVQEACQLEVDGQWDTGRVDGWHQQVTYTGPALESRAALRWRVRAWTSAGATEWSAWATFETGLLTSDEWFAAMITATADAPVVRFARVVEVPDDVVRARLRLTAHGIATATIGGVDVSDEVLAPGWTSYHHRLAVRTHDVGDLLRPGPNELAVLVAPGWFSGRLGFEGKRALYGDHVGALMQLELDRSDGSRVVVATDDTWSASATPFLAADLYDGETYDARLSLSGAPAPVSIITDFDHAVLCAPPVPPVRRTGVIAPVATTGNIFDFGQNLVGWLRLTLRGVPVGTEVMLRHAEVLDGDGRLFTAPLRTAQATDTYIASGADEEVYEPRFTFHGFRYAEISGVDPAAVDAVAVVIHSDVDRIGHFTCSDPLIERLHENVVWGQRGNFVSVPTDCPQRDERLGWTGDAQVFSPTASFLHDCETFWENWLEDLAADQTPAGEVPNVIPTVPMRFGGAAGWGDAAVIVPWTTYVAYGDDAVLRRALPSMAAWVDYVFSRLDDEHRWSSDFQFGDWLDPDAPVSQPWRAKARFDLVATAHAAHIASLLSRSAAVVGDDALAATAAEQATTVRTAWWAHYGDAAAMTQTGAALAIAFDLAPDDEARLAFGDALALRVHADGDHLSTGFLGTPVLLPALAATGHLDVAYDVLLQRTCPSWLYQVLAGATTVWERWDALRADGSVPMDALGGGSGAGMVSFNHYAYGAVADWLHTAVAGLRPDPDDPGYHHILIEPRPGGGLTHASASLLTRYGRAGVAWRLDHAGALHVDVDVPPNTSATVTLPGREPIDIGSGRRTLRA